eukprot:306699-Rhodomonas_salina.1
METERDRESECGCRTGGLVPHRKSAHCLMKPSLFLEPPPSIAVTSTLQPATRNPYGREGGRESMGESELAKERELQRELHRKIEGVSEGV